MAQWNKLFQRMLGNNEDIYEVQMLADQDGNIINSFGAASNVPIAAGLIGGYSHINKFGYTGTDQNGTATVWDANSTTAIYPYPAAGVVTMSSTSGDDTGDTVEIQGLDGDYNQVTEEVNIGSTGTTTFSRIFRARMTSVTNVGTVTVNQGGSLAAQIRAGNGQTLMAVYTIPAGKTGYLLKIQGSMDKQNAPVVFKLFARPFGNGFNIKGQWGSQGGNSINYDYPVPLVFPEKTDIRVDVTTGGTCGNGATFDILLVDNN